MSQIILKIFGKEEGKEYIDKHPFLKARECVKWLNELYLRTKGKKGFSRRNLLTHVSRLHLYLKYTNMSPKELIDEAEADLIKTLRERTNSAGLKIRSFFDHLKENGKAPKSAYSYTMTVKGFYKHNGFQIRVYIPEQQVVKGKIRLDKELLRKALYNTQKLRDKAIFLMMVSSGMSIEDVLDLKYQDIKDQLEAGEKPLEIRFARVKNNKNYITFLSSEAVNVLKQYIETERKDIKPNDPVFINSRGKPLIYSAIRRVLVDLSKKTIGNSKINTKSFRRFFSTEMRRAGIPADWVEYMMGHETGQTDSYFNDGVLRDMYEEKENVVTILTTVVKERAEDIRREVEAKYQEKFDSYEKMISQLRVQMESITQKLGD